MRFWTSSECDKNADKACTTARKRIEAAVVRLFAKSAYGEGVSEISYIVTILSAETRIVLDYPERRRFSKKEKAFELRLAINHPEFIQADKETQLKLMCLSVLDGLRWISGRKIEDFDGRRMHADVERTFREKGWM